MSSKEVNAAVAARMLELFRGQPGVCAVDNGKGGFKPWRYDVTGDMLADRHLSQNQCLGFYLLDTDSRVRCAAVDFDNKPDRPDPAWREKTETLYFELTRAQLKPLVEVSQSGQAAHVWLFFSEPTPAYIPRAFFSAIANRSAVAVKEIYPRQDELKPEDKGLGNLIRFPLWGQSRFVDVEDGWSTMDPVEAMDGVGQYTAEDLSLVAFQLGIGELKPAPRVSASVVVGSDGVEALVPLRVEKLLKQGRSMLSRRWVGDVAELNEPSASSVALSIAVELVRLYVPPAEIASTLRFWCQSETAARLSVSGKIAEKAERSDWINRTITAAYDWVVRKQERKSAEGVFTLKQCAHSYVDRVQRGEDVYWPFGIPDVDDSIRGMADGEVCVIGARPGDGKTAAALQIVEHWSSQGKPTLVISEEMGREMLGKRRLLTISDLPEDDWRDNVPRLRREIDQYYERRAPIYVVNNCSTVRRAVEVIESYVQQHGVSGVAIDYAQLLEGEGYNIRERMSDVSGMLTQATKRNGTRTLTLCQLSREVEKRGEEYEPRMSDLQETGRWEQDADVILFPWWPFNHDEDMPRDLYRILVAKRRNGKIKSRRIETVWDDDRQTIGFRPYGAEPPPF